MERLIAGLIWIACGAVLAACAATQAEQAPTNGAGSHIIYVVSNGWHTAVAVPRADAAAAGLLPEAADFPEAAFLEFGWGDRAYYQATDTTIGLALRAALTPTPAIIHVNGHTLSPAATYPESEVVQIGLSDEGFRFLARAIAETFERFPNGRARPVSPGLDPNSLFYNARGRFHLFNTCNTWTARMLSAAGVALVSAGVSTAEDLMTQIR